MISWLNSGQLAGIAEYRFSSRFGGVSEPPYDELNVASWVGDDPKSAAINLELIAAQIPAPVQVMNPEHGTEVLDVLGNESELKRADIIVTTQKNVALLAPSADCVTVIATSAQKPFLLLAHIGWRGAATGIAAKILSTASLYGVAATELEMVLGPAICGNCYPVSSQVQTAVAAHLPESIAAAAGEPSLDLRVGLTQYFTNAGVKVLNNLPCTHESTNLFSYRRDHLTGRQAAIAWLS